MSLTINSLLLFIISVYISLEDDEPLINSAHNNKY